MVVLNGPPRAGKSSIAAAIQDGPGVWFNLGVDLARAATPPSHQPGIGLRPGGERPDLEDFVVASYLALYDSVVAHARRGIDVVVDVGHHDSYSRPLRILQRVAAQLAELRALFVGVRCPVEILMHRRYATGWIKEPYVDGDPIPEAVVRWSQAVHEPGIYDLDVDTSKVSAEEAASTIRSRVESGPTTAFAILAGVGRGGDE